MEWNCGRVEIELWNCFDLFVRVLPLIIINKKWILGLEKFPRVRLFADWSGTWVGVRTPVYSISIKRFQLYAQENGETCIFLEHGFKELPVSPFISEYWKTQFAEYNSYANCKSFCCHFPSSFCKSTKMHM